MNINIRSIPAFRNIADSSIKKLEQKSKILNFKIGKPICPADVIPDQILIILSGEARLLEGRVNQISSVKKLKSDSFIGLASLLTLNGCEHISASSEIMALAFPERLILEIFKEDREFKKWCNTSLFFPEIYLIASKIQKNLSRTQEEIIQSVDILLNKLSIEVITNNTGLEIVEEYIYILSSANVINKKIGDLVNENEKIEINGSLPARVLKIPKSVYKGLLDQDLFKKKKSNKNDLSNDLSVEVRKDSDMIDSSKEDFGLQGSKNNFKIIKATGEIRECLACLQMLALKLNLPYRSDSIEKILRDVVNRGKKPTMELLGGITSTMGLQSSFVKIDPSMAGRLPFPSIVSWRSSFAIVTESNTNFLEIVSPSQGKIHINPEQFKSSFEKGFIELLCVEKTEQTPEKNFGIEWFLPKINRYRGVLLQVLLASFVVQLFGLANPLMIQVIIDKVISQRSLDTLQILGIALVVVTILGGVISSLRTFLFAETTNRIDTRLGAEVIDHLLRLPLNYFDKKPVGELGSRIGELEKIRNFLTGQALTTVLDAAFSLIYIVVMVIYSWLLTLIALGVVPIQIGITLIGSPLIRGQIREVAQRNAKTQSHLVEVLTGIQTVKAQNVERVSRWKWQDLYTQYISKSFQRTLTGTALQETSQVLQQLSQLVVLWVGASLVLNGQLSLGQLIAFRIISGYVTQPLLRLSSIWQNIQELRVSFERLADIVDTPEETTPSDKEKIPLPSINGKIEFQNISFNFKSNQPDVLKNVNLEIKPGQFVGIVGQSGSGKSTLVKLLPRLYKPQTGRILIDGYDVDKVELYSLRRQIGIVPQEPLLFAGTINENIALTDPDTTSDEIVKASRIANAHEFIMNLQDGYSTNVGERGAGLSGGQKQRIAIARTLLSNPKLLIMDEATSALDYETEKHVCEGLKTACKGSTVLFITHRLSTVKNADLIVMLHQGLISEIGTHNELMNLKGRYFALFMQQESS